MSSFQPSRVVLLSLVVVLAPVVCRAQRQHVPLVSRAQDRVAVPASAELGLFVNMWAEKYDGRSVPSFRPADFLEANTNYRIVVDVAAIPYEHHNVVRQDVGEYFLGDFKDRVLMELVVEDERYPPPTGEIFFSVYGYRGEVNWWPAYWRDRLSRSSLDRVEADALSLLRTTEARPRWLFHRGIFLVRVRRHTGPAPLGILFRPPPYIGGISAVVSTRFCIAESGGSAKCAGFPRLSEYIGSRVLSQPPPVPRDSEISGDLTSPGHPAPPGRDWRKQWTWNSWLFRLGDQTRSPVGYLELDQQPPQGTYVLQVDVSQYVYFLELELRREVAYAPADPMMQKLVRNRLQRGDTKLRLVVRSEAVGNAVEIASERVHTIDVDLTRLDLARPPSLPVDRRSFGIQELSALTAAASIQLELTPISTGCGAVALSLSDENGRRPIDQLVHLLEVRRTPEEPASCGSMGMQSVLSSGIRNILAPAGAPPVDAALHVFEFFPHSRRGAAAFLIGLGSDIHSWDLSRPLTEYLEDAGNLEARIREARQLTKEGIEHAYDRAARELAGALFSGANPTEQRKADAALAALRAFVEQSSEPPTFLARLTDSDGNVLFLPLGLLSAPGQNPVLPKPLNVVLPLPIEDFGQGGCMRDWAVAISDELEGAEVRVPDDVTDDDAWLGPSIEDLRRYFRHEVPLPDDVTDDELKRMLEEADGDGIILTAHHAGGRLRYRRDDFPLQVHEVSRAYGDSSAAVLAICSAGGVSPVDSRFVQRLNVFGLDAAILSPFSLDANYGKVFAIEFSRIVRKAVAEQREATLGELFKEGVAAAADSMRNYHDPKVKGSVGDMGLELILVGNPSLRLCKE